MMNTHLNSPIYFSFSLLNRLKQPLNCSYNIPSHFLLPGCSPCTTAFRLCLKEYQTTEQGASISTGCAFGNSTTKILGGSSFVLSDPGVSAIVLPFTFSWTVSSSASLSQSPLTQFLHYVHVLFWHELSLLLCGSSN